MLIVAGNPAQTTILLMLLFMVMVVIVVFLVALLAVFMGVTRLQLHAFHMLLRQQLHTVHHPHSVAGGLHRGQNGIHPGVGVAAQIQKEIAVPHRQNVGRRRLVGVAFRAGRQQHGHFRIFSGGCPGKIIGREHRGHDL